MVLNLKPSRSH